MKTERSANLPASVRARLQAFASAHKVDFQLVLIRLRFGTPALPPYVFLVW
jgi:hypothetical protein